MNLIFPNSADYYTLDAEIAKGISGENIPGNVFCKNYHEYKFFYFDVLFDDDFVMFLVENLKLNCIFSIEPNSFLYNIPTAITSNGMDAVMALGLEIDGISYASDFKFDFLTYGIKILFFSANQNWLCYFDRDYDICIIASNEEVNCLPYLSLSPEELKQIFDSSVTTQQDLAVFYKNYNIK